MSNSFLLCLAFFVSCLKSISPPWGNKAVPLYFILEVLKFYFWHLSSSSIWSWFLRMVRSRKPIFIFFPCEEPMFPAPCVEPHFSLYQFHSSFTKTVKKNSPKFLPTNNKKKVLLISKNYHFESVYARWRIRKFRPI